MVSNLLNESGWWADLPQIKETPPFSHKIGELNLWAQAQDQAMTIMKSVNLASLASGTHKVIWLIPRELWSVDQNTLYLSKAGSAHMDNYLWWLFVALVSDITSEPWVCFKILQIVQLLAVDQITYHKKRKKKYISPIKISIWAHQLIHWCSWSHTILLSNNNYLRFQSFASEVVMHYCWLH